MLIININIVFAIAGYVAGVCSGLHTMNIVFQFHLESIVAIITEYLRWNMFSNNYSKMTAK